MCTLPNAILCVQVRQGARSNREREEGGQGKRESGRERREGVKESGLCRRRRAKRPLSKEGKLVAVGARRVYSSVDNGLAAWLLWRSRCRRRRGRRRCRHTRRLRHNAMEIRDWQLARRGGSAVKKTTVAVVEKAERKKAAARLEAGRTWPPPSRIPTVSFDSFRRVHYVDS